MKTTQQQNYVGTALSEDGSTISYPRDTTKERAPRFSYDFLCRLTDKDPWYILASGKGIEFYKHEKMKLHDKVLEQKGQWMVVHAVTGKIYRQGAHPSLWSVN